jgi:hypothetical protein
MEIEMENDLPEHVLSKKVQQNIRAHQDLLMADGVPASARLIVYNALEEILHTARALYGAAHNAQESMKRTLSNLDEGRMDSINRLGELQGTARDVDRLCALLQEKRKNAIALGKVLLNVELGI